MTPKEQFRVGFLLKCAEDGKSIDDIRGMLKVALGPVGAGAAAGAGAGAINAIISSPSNLLNGLAYYWSMPAIATGAKVLAGAGVGGALGHMAGRATSDDVDTDELKKQELLQAYKMQAAKIRQLAALKPPKEHINSSRLLH